MGAIGLPVRRRYGEPANAAGMNGDGWCSNNRPTRSERWQARGAVPGHRERVGLRRSYRSTVESLLISVLFDCDEILWQRARHLV